jgi:hypothetical protein
VILPARMQDVHTWTRRGVPSTSALTRWILGSQRRFVLRWECDTLMPKPGRLPQISQTAAIGRVTSIDGTSWDGLQGYHPPPWCRPPGTTGTVGEP